MAVNSFCTISIPNSRFSAFWPLILCMPWIVVTMDLQVWRTLLCGVQKNLEPSPQPTKFQHPQSVEPRAQHPAAQNTQAQILRPKSRKVKRLKLNTALPAKIHKPNTLRDHTAKHTQAQTTKPPNPQDQELLYQRYMNSGSSTYNTSTR